MVEPGCGGGEAVRDGEGEGPPSDTHTHTHDEGDSRSGSRLPPGGPAEEVRAGGVGLPTPPPQQQRPLAGSMGRLCFPDSGRGGCTRPQLRGCPRARLRGLRAASSAPAPRDLLFLALHSQGQKKNPPGLDSSACKPLLGCASLLLRRSGPYRSHSNLRSRVSCLELACSEIEKEAGKEFGRWAGREGAGRGLRPGGGASRGRRAQGRGFARRGEPRGQCDLLDQGRGLPAWSSERQASVGAVGAEAQSASPVHANRP